MRDQEKKPKSQSKAIVRDIERAGALDMEDVGRLDELFDVWADRLPKNRLRRAYYDGENRIKDLGISIPPPLVGVETVVGWPCKAVSALASRVRFDGYTASNPAAAASLAEIVRRSRLRRKLRQAVESQLVCGCDFITLSAGGAGEPPVIITTHGAEDCAAVWDERLGRIAYGMVIMDYDDETGAPVEIAYYDSYRTFHARRTASGVVFAEDMPHGMGRPTMVELAYKPTESQPFGQSRISKAVRSITDSAVREALRTEISAEFFTSPQKYLLGVDEDPYANTSRWEAYIGNIFTVGRSDSGDVPSFGQLAQGSMQPHVEYMRSLAARFSGETNVPLSQLGIVSDNPSSAEAIYASEKPLIIEAETLIEDGSDALAEVAQMALALARGVSLDSLSSDDLGIVPHFKSPLMSSIATQADAMVKIAGMVDGFANTPTFWEQMGFSEPVRNAVMDEIGAVEARRALAALMGNG